jgi:hypothetical protein
MPGYNATPCFSDEEIRERIVFFSQNWMLFTSKGCKLKEVKTTLLIKNNLKIQGAAS